MSYATLPYAKPANVATTFTIQVQDAPGTTAQASERAYGWAGNRVEVIRADGTPAVVPPNASGVALVDAAGNRQGTLTNVTRVGTSRSSVIYRKVSGGGATITPGTPHTVVVSARLRMSIWAFTPPFTSRLKGNDIELDRELLDLLKDARVDDLSLVETIGWDRRGSSKDKARKPRWLNGSIPAGSAPHREAYMRKLIDSLHEMGVQVIAGFALVKKTGAQGNVKLDADDFASWLATASADEVEEYAASINHFFESRGLDVDGIGFDLEFDEIRDAQARNVALLYRKTGEAIAHHNGLLSYANAPFLKDGVHQYGFMKAQPYALATTGLNLLARPMCFGEKSFVDVPGIASTIACALRKPNDPVPGGAGLHPSQLQVAVWTSKVNVATLCKQVLRPNRVGLMLYSMPPVRAQAKWFLQQCKLWNEALNPDEGPPGQDGLPLQVPRGYGNWPVQRALPVQGPAPPRP